MANSHSHVWVVLLRGINVGGHRKVPMAELRNLAEELGYSQIETYLNSGNLVAFKRIDRAEIRQEFESGLSDRFGFEVDVVVRSGDEILGLVECDPFPKAAADRPNLVHIVFGTEPPTEESLSVIDDYRSDSERAVIVGDQLWIDYAAGAGRSKVTHDVLRRALGGVATSRNLRTVRRLSDMVAALIGGAR